MKQIDSEIASAAAKAASFGSSYEDRLAKQYLTLNDKSYLQSILAKLERDKADELTLEQARRADEAAARTKRAAAAIRDYEEVLWKNGSLDPHTGKAVKAVEPYSGNAFSYSGPRGLLIAFEDDTVSLYRDGNYWQFPNRDSVP